MAQSTDDDDRQTTLPPIHVDRQLLPGTFEDPLHARIDPHGELAVCAERARNDAGGAPADDPAMLVKSILFASSKGITAGRQLARRWQETVVCLAVSADTSPHGTTLAHVGAARSAAITASCRHVRVGGDAAGRIGQERCAVEGVPRPRHASALRRRFLWTFGGRSRRIRRNAVVTMRTPANLVNSLRRLRATHEELSSSRKSRSPRLT